VLVHGRCSADAGYMADWPTNETPAIATNYVNHREYFFVYPGNECDRFA